MDAKIVRKVYSRVRAPSQPQRTIHHGQHVFDTACFGAFGAFHNMLQMLVRRGRGHWVHNIVHTFILHTGHFQVRIAFGGAAKSNLRSQGNLENVTSSYRIQVAFARMRALAFQIETLEFFGEERVEWND